MTVEELLDMFSDDSCKNIQDSIRKLHANLKFRSKCAAVSISGGSDSDVLLDMVMALEPEKNYPENEMHYVWFDTGLEYQSTKDHLCFLEQKYGITIERKRAKTPVPLGCKLYGLPFMSKQVAAYIGRLQAHGFKWEDRPFAELYAEYPDCKAALRFWCNEWGADSRINISNYKLLKEFMVANPPDFRISEKCCDGAKKDVAHDYLKQIGATINLTGVRRAEGGARATVYSSCFSEPSRRGHAAQFRPLFFMTDQDKEIYCERRGVTHSDLYERYGFIRTGCACCPFGSRFEEELDVADMIAPGLAKAARNMFGAAYEYTRAYRKFKSEYDEKEQQNAGQTSIWEGESFV